MKMFSIRLLLTIFLFLILELIVINIAGLLPFMAIHKENITDAPYMEFLMDSLLHPLEKSSAMMEEKNPLFFLGSGGALLLILYVVFFAKERKGEYELADKYGVYGKARWARKNEIFIDNETVGVPVKQLMQDLEASMMEGKGDKRYGQ